ncbi:uncharacterized protein LOC121186639 [Toxotes jaculatrix]|uniref:uncharacterized protein LOC121186639 n=1 Tax=Toxotes jaculatrix TaxID=941984 RepID=UPI001B3AC6D4|nr:uncharacterized protein LOC121186639 [Toxotes jaculatrix]
MERRGGQMRTKRTVSPVCMLLLALLQITTPSSAQNITTTIVPVTTTTTSTSAPNPAALSYRTHPVDIIVAVGEPAVFSCGVPETFPNLTFIFYGSHGIYNLTCPYGHEEDIPQALYGSCYVKNGESLAVWTLRGTSFSDNGTRVMCQQLNNRDTPAAVLYVYDNGSSYATLIGCTIGGFFGILLVFGLSYITLQRSERFQKCFRGKDEDDLTTIVSKD